MVSTGERRELLDELQRLAERFPVPHPSWHGYVDEMHACMSDLRRALAVARRSAAVPELVASAIEGDLDAAFANHSAGPELRAAYRRLGELPIPEGRHPFLDEIVPALEGLEALLVAISLVPEAVAAFERRS